MSHTAITTIPAMGHVTVNLNHLNLSHTCIKRLAAFTFRNSDTFWHLEILDLRATDIEDVEAEAYTYSRLRILSDLHSDYFNFCCPQIRGAGITAHTCHAPTDPLSSCSSLLENRLLKIFMWPMGVASLLDNAGVLVTRLIAGRETVRLPYAQLSTQLVVSDFMMGV